MNRTDDGRGFVVHERRIAATAASHGVKQSVA